jgi:hypothetical protein
MLRMTHKRIDSIFKKDPEGGYYDNKARLFQDILIFGSTLKEGESFKLWDLAKFLLNKNVELRNRFAGERHNDPNKVVDIQRRIKRNIESLVTLRLMKLTGHVKEEKGTGLIPTFSYTRSGYFLSQIIQCLGNENTEAELYHLFSERLFKVEKDSPSVLIFASKMIKKIYEKGLFGRYVSTFQKVLDSKDVPDIEAFAKLMQNTISLEFQRRLYVNEWEETINELEREDRRLYLYEQKLAIDTKMGGRSLNKEYEKLRLKLMGDTERIALEGFCGECQQRSVFSMKIIEYTRRLANAHLITLAIRCPKCNGNQRTLQLPNLWG